MRHDWSDPTRFARMKDVINSTHQVQTRPLAVVGDIAMFAALVAGLVFVVGALIGILG